MQWFPTWGSFVFLRGVARASDENIHKYFYISYSFYGTTFVVAKMIGSPDKNHTYFFIQNCFKCDYHHHHKILSVIMTITVLLCLAMLCL